MDDSSLTLPLPLKNLHTISPIQEGVLRSFKSGTLGVGLRVAREVRSIVRCSKA